METGREVYAHRKSSISGEKSAKKRIRKPFNITLPEDVIIALKEKTQNASRFIEKPVREALLGEEASYVIYIGKEGRARGLAWIKHGGYKSETAVWML